MSAVILAIVEMCTHIVCSRLHDVVSHTFTSFSSPAERKYLPVASKATALIGAACRWTICASDDDCLNQGNAECVIVDNHKL